MTAQIIEHALSPLPSPYEIAQESPLNQEHRRSIQMWRESVRKILSGKDPRLLLIVGPCSIHDRSTALEYGQKLKELAERVEKKIFIVMRSYIEKPRTIMGWKGFLHDPHLDGSHDFLSGIRQARSLFIDLTEIGLPCASELLELTTSHYYSDFLTWGCIGARTSSSQPHRQLASAMPFPIGFKNSTEGNLEHPIHGIIAAQMAQTFIGINQMGQLARIESAGNSDCHLVLRGSSTGTNYDEESLNSASLLCKKAAISSHLIVDCSHDNSRKKAEKQIVIFQEMIRSNHRKVKALMLESHLKGGNQEITPFLERGLSVTDPCLSWSDTEALILEAFLAKMN